MLRAVRHAFLTRALREKFLLLAFIGVGALWWFSAFATRAGGFWREQRSTSARLAVQNQWIKNRAVIEQSARKTADRLDPARTLNGNQLVTTVDQLAKEAGLRNGVGGTPTTEKSGQFTVHTAEYNINNVGWEQLLKFYRTLGERSPYISIERFVLTSAANNPSLLTLQLKVVSVEITQ
ncbi:MAG: hypothetical protein HZC55_24230 [Verrucomicrobia bacterium]|nr:hypothetical protein [Verrucomicrobiota bacterium]